MQKKERARTDFWHLLRRGRKLYSAALGATFPATLLCVFLPTLIMVVAGYYCLLSMFRPVVEILQAIVRSLMLYGFDEWAVGEAVERVTESLRELGIREMLMQMLGSVGGIVLLAAFMVPVRILCRAVVTPLGQCAAAEAHSRGWHGVKVSFKKAFAAIRRHTGRIVVLCLIFWLVSTAAAFVMAFVVGAIALIPVAGGVLAIAAAAAFCALMLCLWDLMLLIGLNEDQWHFKALGGAFRHFFTDWAYLSAGLVFCSVLVLCLMVTVLLDALLMVLAMFPPVVTLLTIVLALPMMQAFDTVIYYDRRRREGYELDCALE